MTNDIVPASLAVQAMRDNGYKNAAYAIAELIDNSIQAGATLVELLCAERREIVNQRMRSRIHQIAVLDNGCGMSAEVLKIALQFGNGTHLTADNQRGMGKFGMGLPSASISQCTHVEVWSWQDGPESALYTYLDVDQIRAREQTALPEPVPRSIPDLWRSVSTSFEKSGTLVVWSNLDRIFWKTANAIIDNSELLVGRMYRRFIHDSRTRILLADFDIDNAVTSLKKRDVLPNDPLYLMDRTSCPEPFDNQPMFEGWGGENYEVTYQIRFRGQNHPVTLRFAVAKKEARSGNAPGSLPHGRHAAKNVGVSIMRADRELDLDQSWIIQYDPVERWWGIELEFPPALDEIFGVTNNKQAARNFAELSKLDINTLLKDRTIREAMDDLEADGDPRAPLLEIAQRISKNLTDLRKWLARQSQGSRSGEPRHNAGRPEQVATTVTHGLQDEGHKGKSDSGESLPPEQRREEIKKTLVESGVPEPEADGLAAVTVSEGYKYLFSHADLDTPAFFTVKMQGGGIQILLNSTHPAYQQLLAVVEDDFNTNDVNTLRDRLTRTAEGLKLLLCAWARYEDEQPDGAMRNRAQQARSDWGSMARRFLERDE